MMQADADKPEWYHCRAGALPATVDMSTSLSGLPHGGMQRPERTGLASADRTGLILAVPLPCKMQGTRSHEHSDDDKNTRAPNPAGPPVGRAVSSSSKGCRPRDTSNAQLR